jgi:type 1 glutamine amidotransferase
MLMKIRRLVLDSVTGRDNPTMTARAGRATLIAAVIVPAIVLTGLLLGGSDSRAKPEGKGRVLVFSKTAGFRHDSIPAGIAAIRQLGRAHGFSVSATEDASAFRARTLRGFNAVVFLNTTGDVLGPAQQSAFRAYIRHGGGFAGVHAATDTEYDWPFYDRLIGTHFQSHPAIQPATVEVADRRHPSTRDLPRRWTRADEWYNFAADPRGRVHVLAVLDESTYSGGTMGADHPIAWCHRVHGGRSWYTALGHAAESYSEPLFRKHLLGGILWAAGLAKGDCRSSAAPNGRVRS